MSWLRRNNFPVICGCCGKLVTQCWERGHDNACDECRGHFWKNGEKGDKPCDVVSLVKGLNGGYGWAYKKGQELRAAGIESTIGEEVADDAT